MPPWRKLDCKGALKSWVWAEKLAGWNSRTCIVCVDCEPLPPQCKVLYLFIAFDSASNGPIFI